MMSFKGKHFPKDVILFAVHFYLRYPVSYQDLEEIMPLLARVSHLALSTGEDNGSPPPSLSPEEQEGLEGGNKLPAEPNPSR